MNRAASWLAVGVFGLGWVLGILANSLLGSRPRARRLVTVHRVRGFRQRHGFRRFRRYHC
jgi:hypothetical protein